MNADVRCSFEYDDGDGPALYLGGEFTRAEDISANHIVRWDGNDWATLGDAEQNV